MNKTHIEEQINRVIHIYCEEKNKNLVKAGITLIAEPLSQTGSEESYFSEIEVNVWEGSHLIDCLSIIIFLQGKLCVEIDRVEPWLDKEIQLILQEREK